MMLCPDCQAPLETNAVFCGYCGTPLPSVHVREAAHPVEDGQVQLPAAQSHDTAGDLAREDTRKLAPSLSYPLTPSPSSEKRLSISTPEVLSYRTHPRQNSTTGRNLAFIAVILALLGVGIGVGVFTLWQPKGSAHRVAPTAHAVTPILRGMASFHDSANATVGTDMVVINANGLNTLPTYEHYEVWLVNEGEENIHLLGTLEPSGDAYTLTFTNPSGNLLALGSKLQVTLETAQTSLPTGHVLMSGEFPPHALVHMKNLLVSYEDTPQKIALLPGLREQTRQLNSQAQLLRSTNNKTAIQCIAQNLITILEGQTPSKGTIKEQDCHAAQVSPVAPNFGLLGSANNGYVHNVGTHASLAAIQSDATDTVRHYAQQVEIASDNLNIWLPIIHQNAQSLLAHPQDPEKINTIVTLSDHAFNGVDTNDNGNVDPISGEAGALQAYLSGQSMFTLRLTATR